MDDEYIIIYDYWSNKKYRMRKEDLNEIEKQYKSLESNEKYTLKDWLDMVCSDALSIERYFDMFGRGPY